MAVAYVDTSVMVAILLRQRGFQTVQRNLRKFDVLCASNLLEAELRSTLVREGFPQNGADKPLSVLRWILPDRSLTQELEKVLAAGRVRGADLWHLACALYLSPEPGELHFFTLDEPQKQLARAVGFIT